MSKVLGTCVEINVSSRQVVLRTAQLVSVDFVTTARYCIAHSAVGECRLRYDGEVLYCAQRS